MTRLAVVACVVAGSLAAVPAQTHAEPVGGPRALLERYTPILRYDSRERYFAQPVVPALDRPRARSGDRVYGHVARKGRETWLQYWFFYAYNPQDRGVFRTGRHEGDWEFVQLRLGPRGQPQVATFAQHDWAEGCAWSRVRREPSDGGTAPVVYVANGSHASYPRPGTADRPFPDPNDEANGRGRRVRPQLVPVGERSPGWLLRPGRWGQSRAGIVPGEQSSPKGPRFRDDRAWSRPAAFHRAYARPCGAGPPGRAWPWLLASGVAVAVAVLLTRRAARR